jgi:hypothetical protein
MSNLPCAHAYPKIICHKNEMRRLGVEPTTSPLESKGIATEPHATCYTVGARPLLFVVFMVKPPSRACFASTKWASGHLLRVDGIRDEKNMGFLEF